MTSLLGPGILSAEGQQHRRTRRVIAPAFTEAKLRELYPVFNDKARELNQRLSAHVEDDAKTVDIMKWLTRTTLDVIGLAGFGYEFNALASEQGSTSPLWTTLSETSATIEFFRLSTLEKIVKLLRTRIPLIDQLPTAENRRLARRITVMQSEARKIVRARQEDISNEFKQGKDLLTLLRGFSNFRLTRHGLTECMRTVKANNDEESKLRLSEDELLAQITAFQFAG